MKSVNRKRQWKGMGFALCFGLLFVTGSLTAAIHSETSAFPSYRGRVMAGYQGWFRVPGDGSGRGWVHWGARGQFGPDSECTIDVWPDVSEYPVTYPSGFYFADGSEARVFSSYDESTVDTHFRWMKEYGIDGVFVQRFFARTKGVGNDSDPYKVLRNCLTASRRHGRAMALMYDLSGLKPGEDTCESVIEDWKRLVDDLQLTRQGDNQTYLYHDGGPLVAIWGIGFPDRPYDIREIQILELIDFLKNDPVYGGCTVMLGVPNYFRERVIDSVSDPFLHEVIEAADVVLPWMVKRFSAVLHQEVQRYHVQILRDRDWCETRGLDYVPLVYPGMSWRNLSIVENRPHEPVSAIPRLQGHLYWMMLDTAIHSGAEMLYVAMFDEVDEGTAIFKLSPRVPVSGKFEFVDPEGVPSDYYLKLSGEARTLLRAQLGLDP